MSQNNFLELITKPKRPKFRESIWLVGNIVILYIRSEIFALLLTLAAWLLTPPPFNIFFRMVFLILLMSFIVIVIISTINYIYKINKYMLDLEKRIYKFKKFILVSSGIEDVEADTEFIYHISAIAKKQGTVNLVLNLPNNTGIREGSLLNVVVSVTGEIWGLVQISQILDKQAWAVPIDRINSEFWDELESKMNKYPMPPDGIHLEPYLLPEVRQLLSPKELLER